jgi:anti-sigma B factor antagonist
LWFTSENLGDVQVIKPAGKLLDPEPLDRLIESLPMRQGMQIVLDFSDVQYLSSPVLGRLLDLKKQIAAVGGRMALRSIHPDLREVFRLCRLDHVFDIEP